MRVLWLCNVMLPAIAEKLQIETSVKEGWISGILERYLESGSDGDMQLAIVFPADEMRANYHNVFVWNGVRINGYGFYENMAETEKYQPELESRFTAILNDYKPDVVHVFGTEYPHALAMAKVMRNPNKLLVGIQGVISVCAKEYFAELPKEIVDRSTFRDWIKNDNIKQQRHKFEKRGKNEIRLLKITGNVTGRTEFDRKFSEKVNPNAEYYSMNETLRQTFYSGQWEVNRCKKYRIFFSQADYPLKGFHFLLDAMPIILGKYPDAEVVIAGNNIMREGLLGKLKISSYGNYLKELINKYQLQDKVHFVGKLSAEEMKKEYLQCHTYVCASVLENSPNSVGEAMLLGVPVVCANVGGVPSLVEDRMEGILFEKADSKALAEAVISVWQRADISVMKMSKMARTRAQRVHDRDRNYTRLLEIYRAIEEK